MCGCNRSKAKSFNQRRNAKIASTRPDNTPAAKPAATERGVSQERRRIEKRRRNIIRNAFGK